MYDPSNPLPLGPWTGGLNLVDPQSTLPPSQVSLCQNVELDVNGWPKKRQGSKKFGSSPAKVNGDNLVNFLFRYYYGGGSSKKTIAAAGGKLFSIDDVTGISTQININGSSGQTMEATLLVDKFVYKDRLYILDGTKPQRYDGTNDVYAGGFTHDPSGWTLTPGAGGSMTVSSTYLYIITDVAGDMGEGPQSASKSTSLSGAQNQVAITNIDLAPASAGTTAKRIYRTKANGTIFYFVAEISAVATSYTDTMADSALGAELIHVHVPRTDCRYAVLGPDERVYWFGRAGSNASLVEASDPGFPDRILDSEFFAVSNNDGDVLTGGGRAPNGVLFFKGNSAWLLRGFGYALDRIGNNVGTRARFSVVETPWGTCFLSQEGQVYLYDGAQLNDIGYPINSEFRGMSEAAMARVFGWYKDFAYYIEYDPKGTSGYNRRRLRFDLRGKKWDGPHENADFLTASYVSVWDSYKDSGQVLWGEAKASKGSFIYQRDETQSLDDSSQSCIAKMETSQATIRGRGEKKFYRAFVKGNFSPETHLYITHINDDNVETEAEVIAGSNTITPADAGYWNISNWDAKVFWDPNSPGEGEQVFGQQARSKTSKFRIGDKGTSSSMNIEEAQILVEVLPLK